MSASERQDTGLIVGVVGLGVGEQHAVAYARHPAVRRVLLCDLDAGRSAAVASRLQKSAVAASFESMIRDPAVDAVSIASFDDAHFGQVVTALAAGKHVFVEKPLCRTFDELAEIKRLWAVAGGRLQLGSNLILRTAQLYAWLRGAVAQGEFGDIYAFDGDYLYGRLHKVTEGWRRDVDDYSVMQGGGIHLIDLLLWITGQRPRSVAAAGNSLCSRGSDFRYNDFCAATLHFESGMVARVTANYGCVHRHHHVMRVFGTHRTMIYDDAGARMHYTRDPACGAVSIAHAPLPASKGNMIPEFIAAMLGDAGASCDAQGFFDGVSVAIACDRAVASGQVENVEYV
jgi:predicted dehydrogenase